MMNNSKLLMVDDEPMNLFLYCKMLKEFDFEVFTASNGRECIERARAIVPDLILLDWNMPVMDGIQALEILKNDQELKDIPVIMITGVMNTPENLALAMSLGASDFLRKPFEKLELNARIKNTLLLSSSIKILKEQYRSLENKNIFITSLIESIPHPVVYHSPNGTVLLCNKFLSDCLKTDSETIAGKTIYTYFLNNEIGLHALNDVQVIQTGHIEPYEAHVFDRNKTYVVSKNVVRDNKMRPIGIISVYTDISKLKKANEELINTKKMELVASALQLMHVNELNESMINELAKVLPFASKEGRKIIQDLTSRYKANLTEQIWSDFEIRFENAFDSFYQTLMVKYPALTSTERKLCALLRMGLTSKEVAGLTLQNPQSVDVARYRLRKKFNLGPDDNLLAFLLKVGSDN